MAKKGVLSNSICWSCGRSTDKTCSWAKDFTPVKGWKADRSKRKSEVYKDSYTVHACPMFRAENAEVEFEDEAVKKLCNAVLALAASDYYTLMTCKEVTKDVLYARHNIEAFLTSEYAELFAIDYNPMYLYEEIRRKVKNA